MGEEKPLFIPLRGVWFLQFEQGVKTTEYRAYGPRWNETTCRVGRRALLSYGYSGRRLYRVIARTEKIPRESAPSEACEIYPDAAFIFAIHLRPVA